MEANTLLSGVGFESGGLAAAHAVHNGLTALPETHHFMHGEKVNFGTLTRLALEDRPTEEINDIIAFCMSVGLPTTLEELDLGKASKDQLLTVAEAATVPVETIHNMPFAVTPEMVVAADAYMHAYRQQSASKPPLCLTGAGIRLALADLRSRVPGCSRSPACELELNQPTGLKRPWPDRGVSA